MADSKDSKKPLLRKVSDDPTGYGKLPPQATDIESGLLGMLLQWEEAVSEISTIITDEMFYMEYHQLIFQCIKSLYDKGTIIDVLSVSEEAKKLGHLDKIGGPYKLVKICNSSPVYNKQRLQYYTRVILEKHVLRKIITSSMECIQASYEPSADIEEILQKWENGLESIQGLSGKELITSKHAVDATLNDIKNRDKGLVNSQIYTGWSEFDDVLMLDLKRYIVVAAAQKIGKTAFMLSAIKRIMRNNVNMALKIYTFEIDRKAVIRRFVMEDTKLTEKELLSRKHKLTPEQKEKVEKSMNQIETWDMEIEDRQINIDTLVRDYKLFCKNRPGKSCICIIDNHGFLASDNKEDDYCSKQYAYLRDQTNSLIFVIHHLTTKGIQRYSIENGYEPDKEMVRGSSRLIDFCNALILLHRPNFFDNLMYKLKLECTAAEYSAISKLFLGIVPVNRDGETDIFRLKHNIATNTFIQFPQKT